MASLKAGYANGDATAKIRSENESERIETTVMPPDFAG